MQQEEQQETSHYSYVTHLNKRTRTDGIQDPVLYRWSATTTSLPGRRRGTRRKDWGHSLSGKANYLESRRSHNTTVVIWGPTGVDYWQEKPGATYLPTYPV